MHDTYCLKCNAVNNTYFSPRVTVQFVCEGLVESFARVKCKFRKIYKSFIYVISKPY